MRHLLRMLVDYLEYGIVIYWTAIARPRNLHAYGEREKERSGKDWDKTNATKSTSVSKIKNRVRKPIDSKHARKHRARQRIWGGHGR